MKKHIVATVEEIPAGEKKFISVNGKSICVFNVNGEFYALRNSCPHQGAELCKGSVGGMTVYNGSSSEGFDVSFVKKGEVLRCPWHGWEFDIKTGKSIVDPKRCLVKSYDVTVEESDVEMINAQVETYLVTIKSNYVLVHV
ncbi:Rieske (2Fe-2S) protein [Peribacillus cavernae]|uniref:Rieske (2Fe-2S) protein n=1 Tax=Peribacillus cavernae TaxID=1674310 RepID=A0A3S0W505_9BACI|nr:Rieske (2Fe-2S) protein [Peribacillus cavernae]MDQ0218120.1 3-phenylpropionate/trans-cinnamate dioxygenase ferredoxin subunit [Peribacillus cavernae]RUQ32725.1 Rieske (2Fe-2S) protein [Peribacillus cavernae]